MALDEGTPFRRVKHCKLIWLIQNVYQCRTLRKTCIDGPDYGSKCSSSFPWALKLGQSTKDGQKGISLYIRGVNLPKNTHVNFRVYVRKQTSVEPLLDGKYRGIFESKGIWKSPLLVTNKEFELELMKGKISEFWEIHVELIWSEIVNPETSMKKDTYSSLPKLLCFKELGTDLKKFYKNDKFSDIYIRCDNKEIPAHKAILEARCPYFAQKLNSYSGGNWRETATGLSPPKDLNVMNAFLQYLYTGDIESLMKDGPLPIGIHKCAQRMRKYDLEWLTSPLQLCGYSHVLSRSLKQAWDVGNLFEIFKHGSYAHTIRSELGDDKVSFTLVVKFCKLKSLGDCVSVFLELDKLAKGDGVFALFQVSVNTNVNKIYQRCTGDMTTTNTVGFLEFASIHNFVGISNVILHCSVSYSEGDLSTHIDKMSVSCVSKPEKGSEVISPASQLGDGCHGWINLSNDLGQLLKTENYSDCIIVVGENQFPAHRVILAARSHYFSTVFNKKEEESTGSSKGMKIFAEKDIKINAEMMKIILEEIYTGSSNIKDLQSAKNICNFAKFFGLQRLEMKCESYSESA